MLTDISLPTVTELSTTAVQGSFIVEPLWPGYGQTIGNALRRVLLSSLPGAVITSVMIDGTNHEFSTVPGVEEDVVEIILNLKKLRFSYHGEEPIEVTLQAKGSKEVKASDLHLPAGVELSTPEIVIAHLGGKAELKLNCLVERGRGFSTTESRHTEKDTGRISIDAHFSPVTFVNFAVDHTRVGEVTNFDKLTLQVTTDGSITPKEALDQASRILVDHFSLFEIAPADDILQSSTGEKPKRKKKIS